MKTPSNMVPLKTVAFPFTLTDTRNGKPFVFPNNNAAKATVIMFICNHCPYVIHINPVLAQLAKYFIPKGIDFIAINSNDITLYPQDSPENMKKMAIEQKYTFPYLFDKQQHVAKMYQAACTPDFFIFDQKLQLVYRGQFDDARPSNTIPVTGNSLKEVLEAILSNKPINLNQKPSLGCNIKWK